MFQKQKPKDYLDFEDVLIDEAQKYSEGESAKEKLMVPIKKVALILPLVVVIIFFLLVLARVFYLQVKGAQYYQTLAQKNRSQIEWILPHRGIIYDRFKTQLVYNIPVYSLSLASSNYPKTEQELKTLSVQVSSLLLIPQDELEEKIRAGKGQSSILLKDNLSQEEVFSFRSQKEKWPELKLGLRENRDYLDNKCLSHTLGYMGKITEEEINKRGGNYLLDDYIGKTGIEIEYEELLRGELGIKSIEVSSRGGPVRPISQKEARDGFNIVTTLDYGLQKKVYEILGEMLKKNNLASAAAIALNPQNGDILALVSFPSFNSNQLSQGMSQEDLQRLLGATNRPFFNRAISGTYPPGSTFKPLVAWAALEEKIVTSYQSFNCFGFLRAQNIYNPNISYLFRDWKTHGSVNLKKAIAESCNVYFYIVGGGYEKFKGLGIKKIKAYAQKLGLGKKTGIDLGGEALGLIPDPSWKKQAKQEDWYIGDTYHASIGQGDIALTPLQVAQLYSFIANEGVLYRPRLLLAVEETPGGIFNEIEPELVSLGHFKKDNVKLVKEGLREAVLSGSAQLLKNLPVSSGAKTGTAQFGSGDKTHAWFASFAPYEEPEIVLVVLIEGGGEGARTAMPVAYEVLSYYFNIE